MELRLKTLTPIWTGDIDRDSGVLKEAGIIGSLRWWCEGIVRGMGGYACTALQGDGSRPCIQNPRSVTPDGTCPVCQIFGCTGWARRFRLSDGSLNPLPLFFVSHQQAYIGNANWLYRMFGGDGLGGSKRGRGRDVEFKFGVQTLWSDEFSLTALRRFVGSRGALIDEGPIEHLLAWLFSVVANYGSLGAKPQNGFGVVKLNALDNVSKVAVESGRKHLHDLCERSKQTHKAECDEYAERRNEERSKRQSWPFDLRDLFVHHYEIKDPAPYQGVGRDIGLRHPKLSPSRFIPCAFDIRYKSSSKNPVTGQGRDFGLRPFFKERFGSSTTNLLLGETRPRNDDARSASRIAVSHLFRESNAENYKLRIWGSVPPALSPTLKNVGDAVDEFICGKNGMFPGSTVYHADVNREILEL